MPETHRRRPDQGVLIGTDRNGTKPGFRVEVLARTRPEIMYCDSMTRAARVARSNSDSAESYHETHLTIQFSSNQY